MVITFILAINLLVFLAWNYTGPAGLSFMEQNFSVSWRSVFDQGRYWTLLTTVFSQNAFLHFLINMFVLRSFGGLLVDVLGSGPFVRFYLVAGLIASLGHCLVSRFILDAPELGAVGASGALSGMVMLFALMFPREKLLIMGILPLPALFGAVAFVGLDLYGVYAQYGGGGLPLGHGAHLGGALAGALYYAVFIRRARRQRSGRIA